MYTLYILQVLKKHHILIVDDEPDVLEFLEYNFKKKNYRVTTASDGQEALKMALRHTPDLILLDWMMPVMNGLEVCDTLRKMPGFSSTIIVFLTAKGDDFSEIAAFRKGADDYIVKPIRPSVILARIESILARRKGDANEEDHENLEFPGLRISVKKRKVFVGQKEIKLPQKEFQILQLLAREPGKVFSREEIYREVWGKSVIVGDRTLDVHIRKIRKNIGTQYIETIVGVGYAFRTEDKS